MDNGKLQRSSHCSSKRHAQPQVQTGQDCIWYFDLEAAINENCTFFQNDSDACVLYNNVPACSLDMVVTTYCWRECILLQKQQRGTSRRTDRLENSRSPRSSIRWSIGWRRRSKSSKSTPDQKSDTTYFHSSKRNMLLKDLFKHKNIEKDDEAFHAIASDDPKIIREQGNLEKHVILQLEDRIQCNTCREYPACGVAFCDCDCISAQVYDQVQIIFTDSYKTMVAPLGLVWKQSPVGRGKRITDSKESQGYDRC